MKWIKKLTIGWMVLSFASLSNADPGLLAEHPGYVAIDTQSVVGDVEPNVEVFLEKPLLRMLMGAASEANPEIAELIGQVDLIQVKVYEDLGIQGGSHLAKVKELVDRMKGEGWSQVVRVPEEGETVDVLMRSEEDLIAGLAVFVAEEDEWVFVNLVGMIDPALFGKLLAKLGPKALEGEIDLEDLGEALGIQAPSESTTEEDEIELSREELEPYVGTYMIQSGEEAGKNLQIDLSEYGELFGSLEGEPEAHMIPVSATSFVIPDIEGAAEFKTNSEGETVTIEVTVEGEKIIANRVK